MKNRSSRLSKLSTLEFELAKEQFRILDEMSQEVKNEEIEYFLFHLDNNSTDIPRFTEVLRYIYDANVAHLDIGDVVPDDFQTEYSFYFSDAFQKDTKYELVFDIKENKITEINLRRTN